MTDLDFDELDKAVTSIINKKGGRKVRSNVTIDTPKSDAEVQDTAPKAEPETAPVTPPSAAASAPSITPRRGRFMDMVHPSADMNKTKPVAPAPARVSRQGVVLAPLSEAASNEISPDAPDTSHDDAAELQPTPASLLAEPNDASSTPDTTEPEAPSTLPADESWEADDSYTYHEDTAPLHTGEGDEPLISSRDANEAESAEQEVVASPALEPQAPTFVAHTLEVAVPQEDTDAAFADSSIDGKSEEEILESITLPEVDDQPVSESKKIDETTEVREEPMTSPFVPDVKVEKRPLGTTAASDTTDTDSAETAPAETPAPKPKKSSKKDDDDDPQTLAELDREVGDDLGTVDMSLPAQSDVANAGVVSIAQQYKTTAKPTDETTSPIYDTSTYHTPVVEASKPHHAWVVVVWVLLLLILSAVAGAATYYFMLNK